MNLADLVSGKNPQVVTKPATAIPAILARVDTNQAENKPKIATIATIAIAPPEKVVNFEETGNPVSCRFWFQVCWAVGIYQEQCTRSTGCRVFRFLEKQGGQ